VFGCPLLQQQFSRVDDRFIVEPITHSPVEDDVGDRDDRHALVVRHVTAHDLVLLAFGDPPSGEVERLVEAVASPRAQLGQAPVVDHRLTGIDHGRQAGRIGCDHQVVRQTAH